MKRKLTVIVAALLCVLMAVPFAMMTSVADAVTVPPEPTATNNKVVYTAFGTNLTLGITPSVSGGATADNPFKTNPTTAWGTLFSGAAKDGGTIVMVGKAYFGTDYTIPATTAPLVITSGANKLYASKYQGDDATKPLYDVEKAGQYCTVNNSTDASVAGQFGMFMINQGKKLTIAGEVIFDDAVILNRSTEATDNPGTFVVTGKLVIKDNVDFVEMGGEVMYHLEVAEGAYAYLHTLGFDAYTGTGTIVVGDEIKDTVTESDFTGFSGNIVDKNGNPIFSDETTTETTAGETTETTAGETTETTAGETTETTAGETTETTAGETTETTAGETTETTAGETTETTAGETTETTAGDTTETTAETTDESANVPQKPTATNNKVVYIAYGTNLTLGITPSENGGATADDPYKTAQTDGWKKLMEGEAKDGGTLVLVGKGYIDTDYTIPATTSPLVITSGANKLYASKYQGTDADAPLYDVEKAGQYCTVNSSKAATAGQFGMFMFRTGKNITIAGEVIFDDAVILSRASTATDNPGSFTVANGGKLVINSNVDFVEMGGEVMYHLVVEEGGVAYLDKLGFDKYTGKGTLVINEALKAEAEPLLADFEGEVVFVKAATDGNGSTTTTAPTDNPTTGDLTLVVAVLAALSVATCISVVIVKKTKEN